MHMQEEDNINIDAADAASNLYSTDLTLKEGTPKKKRGRPRKSEVAPRKKTATKGRPPGEAAAINEMKARLLASPKSRRVLDSILDAALDGEHKNQSAAWKILMDRMLPVSYFEKDKDSGRSAVNITISGIGGESISINGDDSKGDTYDN